jgi:hypothetical protein
MLNLSPNHLDRHPNVEAYSQAKKQIFRNQREGDYAVLNADDPWVAELGTEVPSRVIFFSRRRELASGVFASGGKIYYRLRHLERVLFDTHDVKMRGAFNLENVLAATTAACVMGADFAAIRKAVRAFQGVEHRLEFVRELLGVDFYNNSKATSVDATVKSLEAFDRGVHLIMGGKDKGAPYTPLLPLLKDRVREVLLIGAAGPVITQQLAGSVELVQAIDLATAVREAFARSRPGDTVLLAPACSSFDQFKDYEERGRVFKELVNQLQESGRKTRDSAVGTRDTGHGIRDKRKSLESGARSPESAKPGPRSEIRSAEPAKQRESLESAVRSPESAKQRPEFHVLHPESREIPIPEAVDSNAGQSLESEVRSPESVPRIPNPEPRIPNPDSQAPSPEPRVSGPEPRTPSPESRAASPVSRELRYVYEVDAEEVLGAESQVGPEDEPAIPVSGQAEVLDDEVLPFEVRIRKSGVRSPESGAQETESQVRSLESGVKETESHVRSLASGVKETESEARIPNSEVQEIQSEARIPNSEQTESEETKSEEAKPDETKFTETSSQAKPDSSQPRLFEGK